MNSILVFPGRQALLQYRRRLQQPAHWGALYTWAGRNSLLQAFLLPPLKLVSEAAGILAVSQALAGESGGPLHGIASSHKLPRKLWRLLLQIKAAGLNAGQLRGSPVLRALGRVMATYQQILDNTRLEDEADALNRVLAYLAKHGLPPKFKQYDNIQVRDILWLRPLDMRLLLGLRGLVDIHLRFALPYIGSESMLRLVSETANVFERFDDLEISWPDSEEPDEAGFSKLVFQMMQGHNPGQGNVILERPAGLYGEVEYLLKQARQQLAQGVASEDILLVFPDLTLYGQMAEDIARRLGLPLAFRRSQPLSHMPMCRALFNLLNLPAIGWEVKALKKVISNKYLFTFFDILLKKSQGAHTFTYSAVLPDLLALLDKAGYMDSIDLDLPGQLENSGFPVTFFNELYIFINDLNNKSTLLSYINCILSDIIPVLLPEMTDYVISEKDLAVQPAQLLARDMQTWQQLQQGLRQLGEAGRQLGFARNNYQVLQEYLSSQASQEGQSQGIMILRLEDAAGLRPRVLLAGGLTHSILPGQPDPFVLSQADRLLLNQAAGMAVWRSQTEEYYGQQLRLNLLLANTTDIAIFTSPQTDTGGQVLRPSIWFKRLAQALQVPDFAPIAGVFGHEPDLLQAYNQPDLRLALVYSLYGPGRQRQLAKALLAEFPGIIDGFVPRSWPPANQFTNLSCLQQRLAAIRHFSASALNEYITCPQRWFFSYMCGLKEPAEASHDLSVMDEGSLAHALLAAYFAPEHFERLDSRPAISAKLEHIWNQVVPRQRQHTLILQGRKPVLMERLSKVIEGEYVRLNQMTPVATEKFFKFTVPGLPALLGNIDRIDMDEREIAVTDYKYSGNIRDKDFQPEAEGAKNVQLLLYLAAMSREYPEKNLRARLVSCKDGRAFDVLHYPVHDRTLADTADGSYSLFGQVREIWRNMEQGGFAFTADPDACQHCAYSLICRLRDKHG